MMCQEGALQYAILMKTGRLDTQIAKEFDFMHSRVQSDGSIYNIGPESYDTVQVEYGYILSCFALGYMYFDGKNQTLANRCYNDTVKVYGYTKSQWQTPAIRRITVQPPQSLCL